MEKKLNHFQKEFMEALADIQEWSVQWALVQEDNRSLEDKYYDITSETIYRVMELLDGYGNRNIERVRVTCEKTGESLKENPYIELHDVVVEYLREESEKHAEKVLSEPE